MCSLLEEELKQKIKEVHSIFEQHWKEEEFKDRIDSMTNETKWKFIMASIAYKQVQKCKDCNPNVATMLLCCCAESLKEAGEKKSPRKNFKKFYLKYCSEEYKKRIPKVERFCSNGNRDGYAKLEEILDFIYNNFRNPFVHQAKPSFEPLPSQFRGLPIKWEEDTFYGYSKPHYFHVNKKELFEWLCQITFHCLCNYFKANTSNQEKSRNYESTFKFALS